MTDQTSRLSVRAVMDSGDYARGAAEVARANKEMAASGQGVVVSLTATDGALSRAGGGAAALARAFVPGAAAMDAFQAKIRSLNTALETGKVTAEQASAIYTGMVQKFGLVANGAEISGQHFKQLGAIINQTNQEMREFAQVSAAIEIAAAELDQMTRSATALRAQIDPIGASQARLNAQLSEYKGLLSAGAISAHEFAQAEAFAIQRHEQFVASLNKTPLGGANDNNAQFRRQNLGYQAFDIGQGIASGLPLPMILAQQGPQIAQQYAGQGGINAAIKDLGVIAAGAVASIGAMPLALGVAGVAALTYFKLADTNAKSTDQVLKEHAENIKALGAAYSIAEAGARSYSEADKAATAAAAQGSFTELLKKQVEAARALRLEFGNVVTPGKSAQSFFQISPDYRPFKSAFDELDSGIRAGRVDGEKFIETINRIDEANPKYKEFGDKILAAAKEFLNLNTEAEKTSGLLSKIAGATQRGFLVNDAQAQRDYEQGVTDDYLRRQGILDTLTQSQAQYNAQIQQLMARSPVQKQNAARAAQEAIVTPGEDPDIRAQRIELAGAQALIAAEHELRVAKEDRQRQSDQDLAKAQYELSLIGQSVAERNRLSAAYQAEAAIRAKAAQDHVAADEKEIASARRNAAAIADINAKASLGKLVEDQGYDAQRLQLEANLIGATVDQRARATAALEAEIRLKQQGIDVSSQMAQGYIREQEALAAARQEIDRQQAAYTSLQQAQGSVIDDLVTGTGTMQDRLKAAASDVLKWFNEIAVANPLKNALTGTNLPTLADLFSGKPQVPGASATTTATMNVTAAVVNMNGGVGGFPLAPGGAVGTPGSLGGLLGLQNGVRPTLTPNGIVNSPVANAANVSRLLPAANQNNGVIPTGVLDAGRGFTTFQMNDGSIIRRDGTFAWRNNNPGNIEAGQFAANQPGYLPGGGRFAAFDTFQHGLDARQNLLFNSPAYANRSLSDAMYRYAPPSENNTEAYIRSLTDASGVNRNTLMRDITPAQQQAILAAQMRVEGNTVGRTTVLQPAHVEQLNTNLSKLSTTTAATQTSFTGLNTSSSSLQNGFSSLSSIFGSAPASTGASGGGFLSSFFHLFGFADGTDFSPGGPAIVGERGPEIVNLPRGSRVVPNHRTGQEGGGGGGRVKVDVGVTVDNDGNLQAYVKSVSHQTVDERAPEHAAAAVSWYRANALPDDIDNYRAHPYERGG